MYYVLVRSGITKVQILLLKKLQFPLNLTGNLLVRYILLIKKIQHILQTAKYKFENDIDQGVRGRDEGKACRWHFIQQSIKLLPL